MSKGSNISSSISLSENLQANKNIIFSFYNITAAPEENNIRKLKEPGNYSIARRILCFQIT